ncbi:myosin heavy chain, cardiac muscle isoform-like [Entelurus aequoreus]|uniref:myosin heavy chain, cardiac muscle isoform-like n=1 Tax=Entelurus aequoreus TaxID=161455 RepID=UPI002B1DECA9|nr:myosin heavy chain, cardiac muscle isoform-like [Entelurus aequoreus]XP_061881120.1 myosin heavy chain, cardiac muscle isoform-like [Entelurus aequoreus]
MAEEVAEILDTDKLYLTQIRHLEDQLDKCQSKCGELENHVLDLMSELRALTKDKDDVTRYLKRALDTKDKRVEMLMEQVEQQQEASEKDKETMEQLKKQLEQLHHRISELDAVIDTQAKQLDQQAGQLVALEDKMVVQKKQQDAANKQLTEDAQRDKTNMIAETMSNMEVVFEDKLSKRLEEERVQNSKKMTQLQMMLQENMTLWLEKDVMQKKELELSCEVSRLEDELTKKPRRKFTRRK